VAKKEKLNILLIEDNGMFLTIAEEMLAGHEVFPARTFKEGWDEYNKNQPDITFLDIALPDGSGQDLLSQIKGVNPDSYVIMMTSSRLREDVMKSMEHGAEGYIMKPFSEEMIQQSIKEYYDYIDGKGSDS
jgi:two-component system chemotaxis response regulator CheY